MVIVKTDGSTKSKLMNLLTVYVNSLTQLFYLLYKKKSEHEMKCSQYKIKMINKSQQAVQ